MRHVRGPSEARAKEGSNPADRTGMMVAVYRMVVQNWTKQDAIAEMKARGFRSGWEEIEEYVTRLDVQGTRKKLASAKPSRVAVIP